MQNSRGRQLTALYYPETVCLDEAQLKYLLLLYDRVVFLPVDNHLNPGHTSLSQRFSMRDSILAGLFGSREDAHYALMYCSESNVWDDKLKRLMELYDELEEKGIAVPLQEREFAEPTRRHPLQEAVDADLKDQAFTDACARYRNEKILTPPGHVDATLKGGGMALRPFEYQKESGLFAICSERVNSALFFAGRDDLFPVSGNRLYTELIRAKLRRAIDSSQRYPVPSESVHKFSMLSWEIATEVVPRPVILKQPVSALLRYRAACVDVKEKFREHLWALEAGMSSSLADDRFCKEISAIVKRDVLPEVRRIREQKMVIWEKVGGQTLSSSCMKVAPALVALHLIPGLSFWEILALGSSVVATAALQPLAEAWQEERKLRRNALFFLVRLLERRR